MHMAAVSYKNILIFSQEIISCIQPIQNLQTDAWYNSPWDDMEQERGMNRQKF